MKSTGQLVRPNGRVCLATAIYAETAAAVQRLALERGSTVSAELRRLVCEAIDRERPEEETQ